MRHTVVHGTWGIPSCYGPGPAPFKVSCVPGETPCALRASHLVFARAMLFLFLREPCCGFVFAAPLSLTLTPVLLFFLQKPFSHTCLLSRGAALPCHVSISISVSVSICLSLSLFDLPIHWQDRPRIKRAKKALRSRMRFPSLY